MLAIFKIAVASPKDIAKLVVCENVTVILVKSYLVKHIEESTLYLLPPACLLGILKVGILCQACKIFLRRCTEIPAMLGCKLGNALPDIIVSVSKDIIKERVEMLAKQLAQPMVRN